MVYSWTGQAQLTVLSTEQIAGRRGRAFLIGLNYAKRFYLDAVKLQNGPQAGSQIALYWAVSFVQGALYQVLL